MDATSFPGFSLLLRERKLVATGHEEMCVNKLRGGGRSSNRSFTKSCGLEDHEILSGVGRRFPLQNSVRCFLLVTITLNLEGRTGYFFISFVLVQRFSNRPANRINLARFASAKLAFRKFAYSTLACRFMNFEEEKLMQKSGFHKMNHHPDGSFKLIVLFSAFVNLSAGARYSK